MFGLKYLYMCPTGTLKNNPPANYVIVAAVNKSNLLSIKDDEMQKTIFDQTMENRKLIRIEVEDYGSGSDRLIIALSYAANHGCDAEVVEGNKVWDFAVGNGYQLGFDFEFTLTEKERYIKYILERSFDLNEAFAVLDATYVNPVYYSVPDEFKRYSTSKWNYLSLTTEYVELDNNNIINYKLNIKTNGIKNFRKMTIKPYIEVTFDVELLMLNIDVEYYSSIIMNNQAFMNLEFKNREETKNLKFIFNNINPERDYNIQPKGNIIKMTFKRKYVPQLIQFVTNATEDILNLR